MIVSKVPSLTPEIILSKSKSSNQNQSVFKCVQTTETFSLLLHSSKNPCGYSGGLRLNMPAHGLYMHDTSMHIVF